MTGTESAEDFREPFGFQNFASEYTVANVVPLIDTSILAVEAVYTNVVQETSSPNKIPVENVSRALYELLRDAPYNFAVTVHSFESLPRRSIPLVQVLDFFHGWDGHFRIIPIPSMISLRSQRVVLPCFILMIR
ncbi:hypothetical protein SCOCK_140120 [Actinacidiphila cocklensis]|uniref:Uncharacterized protein n=1 Tax=Actinacidiphila cocklensis TaxID=887465 RepID=A0A9W4E397_9ACTN|nr:hypothetical protein SCOCK_140120 [Actinacidiphila cocklensis]